MWQGNTKTPYATHLEKFSTFTQKKQMLNSLKIIAEATIFAFLPIFFSQVVFNQYYMLFQEPKKYVNSKRQFYSPNFLCYRDVISNQVSVIDLTIKLPLLLKVHMIDPSLLVSLHSQYLQSDYSIPTIQFQSVPS